MSPPGRSAACSGELTPPGRESLAQVGDAVSDPNRLRKPRCRERRHLRPLAAAHRIGCPRPRCSRSPTTACGSVATSTCTSVASTRVLRGRAEPRGDAPGCQLLHQLAFWPSAASRPAAASPAGRGGVSSPPVRRSPRAASSPVAGFAARREEADRGAHDRVGQDRPLDPPPRGFASIERTRHTTAMTSLRIPRVRMARPNRTSSRSPMIGPAPGSLRCRPLAMTPLVARAAPSQPPTRLPTPSAHVLTVPIMPETRTSAYRHRRR